jgi:hypothetical protein
MKQAMFHHAQDLIIFAQLKLLQQTLALLSLHRRVGSSEILSREHVKMDMELATTLCSLGRSDSTPLRHRIQI